MNDIDLPVRRLVFRDVAPARAMHAALVVPRTRRGPGERHTHVDFREAFLVLGGHGSHQVNGRTVPLAAGDLVLIRPRDVHGYRVVPGQELTFLNVAFPETAWTAFLALAEFSPRWDLPSAPPAWTLEPALHARAEGIFRQALADFLAGGRALHLTRFLGALLPLLTEERIPASRPDLPNWLGTALAAMEGPDNVIAGLPRLVELAGVSLPHLCRTMRTRVGQSPTEFINDLRVRNATALLSTTHLDLGEIAERCGFESLSYFHRQFRRRVGMPPLAYRRIEASRVVSG
ncbi:MAG: helix-turn-helix domain-containing protein [Fimbriimonas sp.]